MVSLSCGKINDTVEPFLILQENFMKLLKKHNCELESIKEGIINVDEFDQLILAIDQKLKEEKVR